MSDAADNPSFITPERLKLKDPNLLPPYERLLLIINNKKNDDMEVLEAIRLALPYCRGDDRRAQRARC